MAERPWRERGAALFVTLSLAAMVFYAGTFHLGAAVVAQVTGAVLLLAFAWAGRGSFLDSLALGTAGGRWWPALVPLLWLAAASSWLLSPVSRAGEAFVVFLLPAAWAAGGLGRLLGSAGAARWALGGCAVVGVAASAWALGLQPLHEQGRAAMPIGHHNQLALVLVGLLPPALLGARRLCGAGRPRLRQGVTLLVGAVLVWTLAATGSLSGLAAVGVQALALAAWALWRAGGRRWLARIGLFLVVSAGIALAVGWAGSRLDVPGPVERVGAVLRLEDPSLLARRTYATAALHGFLERPVLGWGPGATSWTLARHWRPAPGVHPPGEVVTDAHTIVAQAPYELGIAGSLLLLALAGRFGLARLAELVRAAREPGGEGAGTAGAEDAATVAGLRAVRDPELLVAALSGLLGTLVCMAFGVFAVVAAVPAMLILNLGLAVAAHGSGAAPARVLGGGAPAWARVAFFCSLAVGLAWSLERAWASRSYARAAVAAATVEEGTDVPAQTVTALRAAAGADPAFPLYRARLEPFAAARAADGLAPFWLLAGIVEDADADQRRDALERACDLDPLSALAPFELMRLERGEGGAAEDPRVAARAARAILAEPLLLAASVFEGDPDLRAEVRRRILAWPGLPPGWPESFEDLWQRLDWSNGAEGPPRDVLSVDADARPAVSFSLFAFRRPPWPLSIGAVPLRRHRLDAIVAHDLPAATRLPQTEAEPFWSSRCGLE